ncbi:hypothetical protein BMS3Abin04_00829 [bacterium BMS3Abin04]|nr:hypothetical protein BMS3Abin04_00829 [bacterium BMS3Abin04]
MPETVRLVRFNIILFFIATLCSAQTYPDSKVDSLLRNGIDLIISQKYNQAKKTFKSLDQKYPKIPFGKIYLAATHIARTADYGLDPGSDSIEDKLDEVVDLSEGLLDNDEQNIWNNYFMALSLAYKAYFNILTGDYISAFSDGYKSVQYYERCAEIDSNFYESYLALGTYKYWKSAKTNSFSWLPFIKDNREEGIRLLKKTINNFAYNKYLALNSLVWIYIDEKEFRKAEDLSKTALKDYPDSRFFIWGLARAYEDLDTQKAINSYGEILQSLKSENKLFNVNYVILNHKIAMLYYRQNKYLKALNLLNQIANVKELNNYEKKVLNSRLVRVDELREKIKEKLNLD